ncbi:unnamed protein product [Darwinula stevensoni]|uniref:Dehydrogenase/reductase SDR family member 11 n=1 Tax=Darwinula stevensoni TaxID=69355 RepID=A0A7R8X7T9_9CRUS|nr:unnamed protein product [Darwinula stevensoni]CAG0882678.1 unnamed protein product [Darwinula stevensoni]
MFVSEGTVEEWRHMCDMNFVALCLCAKLAVQSMRKLNVDDGHIININSISGHRVPPTRVVHFYSGKEFAVGAITEGLRREPRDLKSHIRATKIRPGLVETEMAYVVDPERAKTLYCSIKTLQADDIADAIIFP